MHLGLQLLGGLRKRGGNLRELKSYSYDPAWLATEFNEPEKDADGWYIYTPSANTRFHYLDKTNGNDATASYYTLETVPLGMWENPGTLANAYKTPEAAYAAMRPGEDDFLLVRRGDVYETTSRIDLTWGKSPSQRQVIMPYGVGDMPVFVVREDREVFRSYSASNLNGANIAISKIRFINPLHDPTSPEFVGWGSETQFGSPYVVLQGNGDNVIKDFIMEGCYGLYAGRLLATSGNDNSKFEGVILRRNTTGHNYATDPDAQEPQGMFLASGSYLIDEPYLAHCGWVEGEGSTANASIYKHSIYAESPYKSVISGMISADPSSMGVKITANIDPFTLAADLTGSAETSVSVAQIIPPKFPSSGTLTISTNSGTQEVTYSSFTGKQFTISETDFSSNPATGPKAVSFDNNYIKTYQVAQIGNVYVSGEIATSFGGNTDIGGGPRLEEFSVQGCLVDSMGENQPTGGAIGWGASPQDNKNSIVSETLFIPTSNASVTDRRSSLLIGWSENNTLSNNISYQSGTFGKFEPLEADINNTLYSNADTIPASEFVDPTRNTLKYLTTLGLPATREALNEKILAQDADNWDTRFTAAKIQEYVRKGFALKNNFYVISDVADHTYVVGDSIEIAFDLIANTRMTFEWYNASDDSLIADQTTYKFNKTAEISDDSMQIYGIAYDENGNKKQSATATINVSATATNKFATSNQFELWSISRGTVTPNTTIDSTGALAADTFTENTDNSVHRVYQTIAVTDDYETISFEAKYVDCPLVGLRTSTTDEGAGTVKFNIQTGVIHGNDLPSTVTNLSITSAANGYYRCSCTIYKRSTTLVSINMLAALGGFTYIGTSRSVILARAMLEDGKILHDYVETV